MSVERRDSQFRGQPSLFDCPPVVAPVQTEQKRQIERVKVSIGGVIVDFFASKSVGERFFAADLHSFVGKHAQIAPASADRVMRDLRSSGVINYTLVSRAQSQYQVESVSQS